MTTSFGDHLRGSVVRSSGAEPKSISDVLVQYRERRIERTAAIDAIAALTDAEIDLLKHQRDEDRRAANATALTLHGATLTQLESDYQSVIREFSFRHEENIRATLLDLSGVTARALREVGELEWPPETGDEQERLIKEIAFRYKEFLNEFTEDGRITLLPDCPGRRWLKLAVGALTLVAAVVVPLEISEWLTGEPPHVDFPPPPIPWVSIEPPGPPPITGVSIDDLQDTPITDDLQDTPTTYTRQETPGPTDAGSALQVIPPALIDLVQPVYPSRALSMRRRGVVRLEIMVDEVGAVDVVKIVQSVFLLTEAAIDAVGQWKYEPARRNGNPISMEELGLEPLPVRVVFRIDR